ncbi:MAG: glycoside hydrolase family 38 C-terminal domain-containing protein [Terrimesophilobacter sp.]
MTNQDPHVDEALQRLEAASLKTESGWHAHGWISRAYDGTETPATMNIETYHLRQVGVFEAFKVEADLGVELDLELDLPETINGVSIVGEALQLTINSLRPIDILVDGVRVFGDAVPVVASGPALIDVVPSITAGHNGRLTLRVLPTPVALDGDWGRTGVTIQFTTARLRERWHLLDLALARLELANEFAHSHEERTAVRAFASAVPNKISATSTDELARLLAGRNILESLAWLDAALATFRIHCIGHSHIDLAWLWTYDDTREVIFRDMRSVVELFSDYPEFRFTHSQARGYAEVEASHPELFAQLTELIEQGRLEPATMQWVESDINIPSGMAQTRQLIEGVEYSRDKLGVSPKVFLAPDTFGQSGNLPQLARDAGAEVYYHHRANPGFADSGSHWQAYWWEGDDGTRVLAVGTAIYLGPVTASRLARDLITLGVGNGVTEICYFYGVGDHGGGPTRADLDTIRELGTATGFPAVQCSTVMDYVTALLATKPDLPVFHGESDRVFEGTYVTRADAKRMNRSSENTLVEAETLGALAGIDAQDELSKAWRGVLHHQFHDILGGSAVAAAYADQERDAELAARCAYDLRSRALAVLTKQGTSDQIVATNSTGATRRDLVTVPRAALDGRAGVESSDGTPLPAQVTRNGDLVFVADLGAFASAQFRLTNTGTAEPYRIQLTPSTPNGHLDIESPFFTAQLQLDSGIITSLFDKSMNTVVVGRGHLSPESMRQLRPELGFGALVLTHELPHPMTSWVIDNIDSERVLLSGASTEITEHGPVRVVLSTVHRFGKSTATVRTICYADLPWIDYEIELDWAEHGSPTLGVPGLALSFGSRLPSPELWVETPFSAAKREPNGYLGSMLRWADLGSTEGGIAVANDSKYGVDALGPRMRIPLVRSAYDPDPHGEADGVEIIRLRVLPHDGSWKQAGVVTMAAGLNASILVVSNAQLPADVLTVQPRIDSGSAVIAGLQTDPAGTMLRLYESTGDAGQTVIGGLTPTSRVSVCDLLGEPRNSLDTDDHGRLALPLRGFQIVTLRLAQDQKTNS